MISDGVCRDGGGARDGGTGQRLIANGLFVAGPAVVANRGT